MSIIDKSLSLVSAFASDSKSRPALQCVQVKREGPKVSAVATDSYIAARITRDDMPDASKFPIVPNVAAVDLEGAILIPAETIAKAARELPKKTPIDVLRTAALVRAPGSDTAELVSTDLETVNRIAFKVQNEAFPDVAPLFTAGKNGMRVTVNAGYLEKIAKMFNTFNGAHSLNGVTIEIFSDSDAVRFTSKASGYTAEALLMPIKQ